MKTQRLATVAILAALAVLGGGCQAPSSRSQAGAGREPPRFANLPGVNEMPAKPVQDQVFRIGDKISVHFVDPANGEDRLFEEIVKADGTITLLSNQVFIVEGKTFGDLEGALRGIYGDKYFRPSQPSTRFYYVAGEVKIPTRQVYVGQLTVLQAIASSGGFTERADKRKVQLTHSGQTRIINCAKAQEDGMLNMEVGPGDRIFVPRSKWLW